MAKSNKYLKIYTYQYVSFFYDISHFQAVNPPFYQWKV
jgi:hypothetical protein